MATKDDVDYLDRWLEEAPVKQQYAYNLSARTGTLHNFFDKVNTHWHTQS